MSSSCAHVLPPATGRHRFPPCTLKNSCYNTNNDFVLENEGSLCAWQNEYNEKTKICKFYLSIFKENKDGSYDRYDEIQKEKCYEKKQIENALSECGFEIITIYGDINKKAAESTDEKWYFVARCKK